MVDRRLQRRQLAVGIENVELAVVLAEGRAGFGMSAMPSPSLSSPKISICDDLPQGCAVVGEILLDADARRP